MKRTFLLFCAFLTSFAWAAKLPDNVYFKAMHDEMQRSMKKLHLKGSPNPYYILYHLEERQYDFGASASLGTLYQSHQEWSPWLNASVLLASGDDRDDSFGVKENEENIQGTTSKSYEGIRTSLWGLTNRAYLQASDFYEKKQSYKRQKGAETDLPHLVPQKQGTYQEELPVFKPLPQEMAQEIVKRLSAKGKEVPGMEDFSVSLTKFSVNHYLLNNLGSFAQYNVQYIDIDWEVSFRTKAGFKWKFQDSVYFSADAENWEELAEKKVDELLQRIKQEYNAPKGSSFLGPVLLMPSAAADLWKDVFMNNASNFGTLITVDGKEEISGSFKNKVGKRVLSNVVNVYDRPRLKTYQGQVLFGFLPIDDEGVATQELTLVEDGFLREIPLSSRPFKKGAKSNGHGRFLKGALQEHLTNIVVEARHPLSMEQLEQQLRQECRAVDLEYCYIIHSLNPDSEGAWERIYTEDGHKEMVTGLQLESGLSNRSLRDIRAAGTEKIVRNIDWTQSIITPALLLEEMELKESDRKPDRKSFVPKP